MHIANSRRSVLYCQMRSLKLGRSTVYAIFHETVQVVDSELKMPGLPLDDLLELKNLVDEFHRSKRAPSPLYGSLDALDGIEIVVKKPPDQYVPRKFNFRKGKYALPAQAVVDSRSIRWLNT